MDNAPVLRTEEELGVELLTIDDMKWIDENIKNDSSYSIHNININTVLDGINVNVSMVKSINEANIFAKKLSEKLEDLENLKWYEKVCKERRLDFLENCLSITLEAQKNGKIMTNKGRYFVGVYKQKTAIQERIENYKRNHTT